MTVTVPVDAPANVVEVATNIALDDKYTKKTGRVFISGIQALVRLPLMQRERDVNEGLNTAGYISGYRGSPLGGYDRALWDVKPLLAAQHIHFEPGVNEDLAATAVWGTQQGQALPGAKFDGVFALWYGKGPGVDRSGDPIRHGNLAGTAAHGGVLLVYGDDHAGKSSTTAHQSDQSLAAHSLPLLYPATVQDYIDFGLLGWALSRYSGLWVGFKCVNETVENTASVDIDPERSKPVLLWDELTESSKSTVARQVNLEPDSLRIIAPLEAERLMVRYRLPRVHAFVRANRIDRLVFGAQDCRFGIVAAGKSCLDARQALQLLGIDENRARTLGIGLYKIGLIWPLEPQGLKAFARSCQELMFVEDKRAFIEDQAARILYGQVEAPRLSGKTTPDGQPLLLSDGTLDPFTVAIAIGERLVACGIADVWLTDRMATLRARIEAQIDIVAAGVARVPYFCSGCPHNRSTLVPEGSLAMGGIGCHGMAVSMRRAMTPTQMGGEGMNWAGIAPFSETRHVFQNLGDGTYSHSGLMAIHAALAARLNITYKILFNDAVAMTGGQPVEGLLTVAAITRQVAALGVTVIRVLSDEPHKYGNSENFAAGATVHHRDALETIQRELADMEGTTVLIYDQTCAAEKRRSRKRGLLADPPRRAFINAAVCEGCGDCSVQSNCVSIEPLETELGRKRRIDQQSCNKDMSCINGFCPSFVTVHGGRLRKPAASALAEDRLQAIPDPLLPAMSESFAVLIAGIGGTGVVTVGALLGMAAHIEGKGASVYDMTGLSQKGGAVFSHLKIAAQPGDVHAVAVGPAEADLVLGCDLLVAGSREALRTIRAGHSRVVLNTRLVPTGTFQQQPNIDFQQQQTIRTVTTAAGKDAVHLLDALDLATAFTGDALAANLIVVGAAWQLGVLPLQRASIEQAIRLNGAAVALNLRAFAIGRLHAHDRSQLESPSAKIAPTLSLEDFLARRMADLTDYQNAALARRYEQRVRSVQALEQKLTPERTLLAETVARAYFKLLAYKDEYEVARLYTNGRFAQELRLQFEGDFKLSFHLAPPLLGKRDPLTGLAVKRSYGPAILWLFRLLAPLRFLRGTPFDPFGHTADRHLERDAITAYEAMLDQLLPALEQKNYDTVVALATLPLEVQGYGHVKAANHARIRERESALLSVLHEPAPLSTSQTASVVAA